MLNFRFFNSYHKSKYHSFYYHDIANGCKYCVEGSKVVIYVTGLCPRSCTYCPLSEKRKNKDIVWADEWEISKDKKGDNDLLTEAKLIDAKGAGITGGDPLLKIDRTIHYIKLLKKTFGNKFHIHLYTSFDLINYETLKKLYDIGLDEIRIHPDLDKKQEWSKINIVNSFNWDVGIEIPMFIDKVKKIKSLIDFMKNKIKFLNLNVFENPMIDDTQIQIQSKKAGLEILKYISKKRLIIKTHLCTSQLKDSVQLKNRLIRRAKNIANDFDMIDEEGLLIRGAIFHKDFSIKYNSEIKNGVTDKEKIKFKNNPKKVAILNKLNKLYADLIKIYPKNMFCFDKEHCKILTNVDLINELVGTNSKFSNIEFIKKDFDFTIITQYPTRDEIIVESEFLN